MGQDRCKQVLEVGDLDLGNMSCGQQGELSLMRDLGWFCIGGTQEPGEGELEKQQRDTPPLLSASRQEDCALGPPSSRDSI